MLHESRPGVYGLDPGAVRVDETMTDPRASVCSKGRINSYDPVWPFAFDATGSSGRSSLAGHDPTSNVQRATCNVQVEIDSPMSTSSHTIRSK